MNHVIIVHLEKGVYLGTLPCGMPTWSKVNPSNDFGAPVLTVDVASQICHSKLKRDIDRLFVFSCQPDTSYNGRPFLSMKGCEAMGHKRWISIETEVAGYA